MRQLIAVLRSQSMNFLGWIVAGLVFVYLGAHDMITGRALYGRFHPHIITPQSDPVFFWVFPSVSCMFGIAFVVYGVRGLYRISRTHRDNGTRTI